MSKRVNNKRGNHAASRVISVKRWPVIRHIRFFWLRYRVYRWAYEWGLGIRLGYPNQSDLDHLDAIWKGKA